MGVADRVRLRFAAGAGQKIAESEPAGRQLQADQRPHRFGDGRIVSGGGVGVQGGSGGGDRGCRVGAGCGLGGDPRGGFGGSPCLWTFSDAVGERPGPDVRGDPVVDRGEAGLTGPLLEDHVGEGAGPGDRRLQQVGGPQAERDAQRVGCRRAHERTSAISASRPLSSMRDASRSVAFAPSRTTPAAMPPALAAQAREIARALLDHLQYVGVLCVEFFVTRDGQLLARKVIRVNDPLTAGGYTFHQNGFGPAPDLEIRSTLDDAILWSGPVPERTPETRTPFASTAA